MFQFFQYFPFLFHPNISLALPSEIYTWLHPTESISLRGLSINFLCRLPLRHSLLLVLREKLIPYSAPDTILHLPTSSHTKLKSVRHLNPAVLAGPNEKPFGWPMTVPELRSALHCSLPSICFTLFSITVILISVLHNSLRHSSHPTTFPRSSQGTTILTSLECLSSVTLQRTGHMGPWPALVLWLINWTRY